MQIGKRQVCQSEPNCAAVSDISPMHRQGRILVCFAILAALASVIGLGQQPRESNMPQTLPGVNSQSNNLPDANQQMLMRQQQAKKQSFEVVNADRKKIIADESALLLKLATDLKTEVDKTSQDTLSLSVIRKAEVIEKLARDVKEKMKQTVGTN
jgi:hypothetical protein